MRSTFVLGLVLALTILTGGAALALGTDGVEMKVEFLQAEDGRALLEHEKEPAAGSVLLRNTVDEPRTVEVYAVAAERRAGEAAQLAERGSAPWFGLEGEIVELAPMEERTIGFVAAPRKAPAEPDLLAAVVLESVGGTTVVTQAVGLIRVAGPGPRPVVMWPWVLLAALMLMGLAYAQTRELLQRRRSRAPMVMAPA